MNTECMNIANDFIVLSPEKNATIEKCDSTLYERLDHKYDGFKSHDLIASYEFIQDWPTWEMHPEGDEIVLLLSGEATVVLKLKTGDKSIVLNKEGSYVIVPRGVWHTAKVQIKAKMLFITPGENTQNREA